MFINKGLRLFLTIFFFLVISARAIPTDTVYIYADSLEKKQVNIDGVWRYHPGDDSLWAQPDFDHSQWDTLDPSINKVEDFKNKWQGFSWFRKVIVFDSAQTGKNFAIIMRHVGASEVYLNGKKALSYGKIKPDSLEEGYSPRRMPYVISPDSSSIQVVAVRYENKITKQYPRFYKRFIDNMGFRMGLRSTNPAIRSFSGNLFGNTLLNTLLAGIFISLFLLYFLLFLFYARKKENLLYALFTLSLGVLLIANPVRYMITTGPLAITLSTILPLAFFLLLFAAYVGFLYAIFTRKIQS